VKHLGDDVRRELGRLGPAAGMPEIVAAWPGAVGDTIARNAWPARIARDGTLQVSTVDSVWAFELTSRAAEIAARLGVDRVRFAPGRLPEPGMKAREHDSQVAIQPSAASRAEGERVAAAIEDEKLRKLVARAAAASLEKAGFDRSV
jgi:Dna[CI] antecedent, DciA